MLDFKTVLELPDKDAITRFVVDKELNEITYNLPRTGSKYMNGLVELGRADKRRD